MRRSFSNGSQQVPIRILCHELHGRSGPRRRCRCLHNDFTGFFQLDRAGTAHIQIVTDYEAVIADQIVAKRANVEMLYRLAERVLSGLRVLPLIKSICDALFRCGAGCLSCFGKADRRAFPFTSAVIASQYEGEFFPIRIVNEMPRENAFQCDPLLCMFVTPLCIDLTY